MSEIELKLAIEPKDLSKAQGILSREAGKGRPGRRMLTSIYYDTPSFDLRQRDMTLRVRRQGRRFVQTVKTDDLTGRDPLRRGEWEDEIGGERPELGATESGGQLPQKLKPDELRPIFSTVVRRTIQLIELRPEVEIEIAADQGEIRADGSAEPISELELELKSGDPAALYDAALRVLERVPAHVEMRSKPARGYLLVQGPNAKPPVRRVGAVELDPDMTADDALQGIGRRCIATLTANAPAVLADCPEGIHQMRVAARRLRCLLSAMKKLLPSDQYDWANGELRWLSDTAGPARNWDVISERLVKPVARVARPDHVDIDALSESVERERRGAYEHAKSELRSPRYTRAIISLSRWLEAHQWRNQPVDEKSPRLAEPISEIAPDLLDRQYRQAKKRGRKLRQAGALQRHRLRIALKKLRYTIDFLCSLFDEAEVDRFSGRLKQLQSELGDSNDVRVAHELLAKLDHGDQPTEISRAAGFVLGWQSERIAGRDDLLQDQFRKFKRLGAFW